MFARSAAILALSASIGANALSTTCQGQIAGLAIGDLGTCLQLTSLLPVLSTSGSIVSSLNTYLTSLCSNSTPTCSNATLTSAQSSIQSGCSSDLSGGGTDAVEIQALGSLLSAYPQVYAAACSKNTTTNDYCVTDTLYAVQNISGTDLSTSALTGLLSGSGNSSSLGNALTSGQLCTGCVQEIYYQALQANSSIASTSVGSAITGQCGASFGTQPTTGVSTASAGASSTAAAAQSSTGAASRLTNLGSMLPAFMTGSVVLAGMAIGGKLVL